MEEKKLKVLMLGKQIIHYRVPILNILAEYFDLTVTYTTSAKEQVLKDCNFKTKFLPAKQISRFVIHKDNIFDLCNMYDVVVAYGQVTFLKYSLLSLRKRRDFKLIYWSIGVGASYTRKYDDTSKLYKWINYFFKKGADGLVFYTDYPNASYIERGYPAEALFVANNTVKVDKIELDNSAKKYLMFIGTLYMQKGIRYILEQYKAANLINENIPILRIVGGGDDIDEINHWVIENNLSDKIHILGAIYDIEIKAKLFKEAIACLSPNQAGLAVLESMGYGVPYVTSRNAITGGEIFNIENNMTGILMNNSQCLKEVLLDIVNDKQKYLDMGQRAYDYYWKFRKPSDMAQGLIDAITYVSKK